MGGRRRCRPDLSMTTFLVFASQIVTCSSFLHSRGRGQNQLQTQPGRRRNHRCSRATPKAFSRGNENEAHQNRLLGNKGREIGNVTAEDDGFFSLMRTAVAAFCAGSCAAVFLSLLLFRASYLSDDATPYQRVMNPVVPTSSSRLRPGRRASDDVKKATVLYRSVSEELRAAYVDEVRSLELFETAARAMLSTLDPYTAYLSPRDLLQRRSPVGVGGFVMKAGHDVVPETLDGRPASAVLSSLPSPFVVPARLLPSRDPQCARAQRDGYDVVLALEDYAYDAGLRVGDVVLEIDGQPIAGENLEKVRERLGGTPGSTVRIAFQRPGATGMQSADVERRVVQFPNVPYAGILRRDPTPSTEPVASLDSSGEIGYIQLRRFGLDAGISVETAIRSFQSDQMKVQKCSNMTPS